ncbi:MAG: hypothetical protein V1743_04865 [Nanoarchaeota archaeon]
MTCSSPAPPSSGGGGGGGGSPLFSKLDYLRKNQTDTSKPATPVTNPVQANSTDDQREEAPTPVYTAQEDNATPAPPVTLPELQAPVNYAKGANVKLSIVAASLIFIIVIIWTIGFLKSSTKYILPKDKKDELHDYLHSSLDLNLPRHEIKTALKKAGWKHRVIHKEMKEVLAARKGQPSDALKSVEQAAHQASVAPQKPVPPAPAPVLKERLLLSQDEFAGAGKKM